MSIRAGISQLFLGDEAMAHLGVPKSASRFLLMGAVPAIYTLERIRPIVPKMTSLMTELGGRWQDHHTAQLLARSAQLYNSQHEPQSQERAL